MLRVTLLSALHLFLSLVCPAGAQQAPEQPTAKEYADVYLLARDYIDVRDSSDLATPISPESVGILSNWLFELRNQPQILARVAKGELWLLIPNKDRADYCEKIKAGFEQVGAKRIALRLDVLRGRELIEFVALDVPSLIQRLQSFPHSPDLVGREVQAVLQERIRDFGFSRFLQLLQARLDAFGYVQRTAKLSDTRSELAAIEKSLALAPQSGFRWCENPKAMVLASEPLKRARAKAAQWAVALEAIAAPSFLQRIKVGLENVTGETLNREATASLETVTRCSEPTGCWSVALTIEASERATRGRAILWLRRHAVPEAGRQGADALFPLGIRIENVGAERDGTTSKVRYSVESHPFLPSQPPIILDELRDGLRALGLPTAVLVTEASSTFMPDLSSVGVRVTFEIPALKYRVTKDLALVGPLQVDAGAATNAVRSAVDAITSDLVARTREHVGKLPIGLSLSGLERSIGLTDISLDDFDNRKLGLSGALELPSLGQIRVEFELDPISDPARAELRRASLPLRYVQALEGKLRDAANAVSRGSGDCISISGIDLVGLSPGTATLRLLIPKGSETKTIDAAGLDSAALLQAVVGALEMRLASCLADRVRRQAQDQLAAAVAKLKGLGFELFGLSSTVEDARLKNTAEGPQAVIDVVVATGSVRLRLIDVTIKSDWSLGTPLAVAKLDLSTAKLEDAEQIKQLVSGLVPGFAQLGDQVRIERLHWRSTGPVVTVSFEVKGLRGRVKIDDLALDAGNAQAAVRSAFDAAASKFVTDHLKDLFADALKDLGPVRTISLAEAKLFPATGGAQLAVRAVVSLSGVELPLVVRVLPGLKVEVEPGAALEKSLLGFIEKYLGGLLRSNSPISKPTTIADAAGRKYGVRFDLNLELLGGGIFPPIRAEGFEVTNRGVTIPTAYTLPLPLPPVPIPPAFAFNNARVTVYTKPASTFAVGGDIVLAADPKGAVVALSGTVKGSGQTKTVNLDASLLVLTIPFAKVVGTLDFDRSHLDANARTVDPLAKVLDLQSSLELDGRAGSADATSLVKLLGMSLSKVELHLRGLSAPSSASATGVGKMEIPGVARAELTVRAKADLSKAMAEGQLDFFEGRIGGGRIKITPAIVDTQFRALGINVRVVVPALTALTPKLIEDIIRRLLDFHPSFDLSKPDITIVLVDGTGKETNAEVGGSDGPPPAQSPSAEGGKPPPPPNPGEPYQGGGVMVTGGQGDGTILPTAVTPPKADDLCRDSDHGEWRHVNGLDKHAMEFDHRERARTNIIHFSDDSRIASEMTLGRLDEVAKGGATVLACFHVAQTAHDSAWNFKKHMTDILSNKVAVIARHSPPELEAVIFQYGRVPVRIQPPPGFDIAVFGTSLDAAKGNGWKTSGLGLPVLAFLAAEAVQVKGRKVKIDRIITLDDNILPPNWKSRRIALLRDVGGTGQPRIIAVSDRVMPRGRFRTGSLPLDGVLSGSARVPSSKDQLRLDGWAVTLNPDGPMAKLANNAPSLFDRVVTAAEANDFDPEVWLAKDAANACALVRVRVADKDQLLGIRDEQLGYISLERVGKRALQWRYDTKFLNTLCELTLSSKDGLGLTQVDNNSGREWMALHTGSQSAREAIQFLGWRKGAEPTTAPPRSIQELSRRMKDWQSRQALENNGFSDLNTPQHVRALLENLVAPEGIASQFKANSRGLFAAP